MTNRYPAIELKAKVLRKAGKNVLHDVDLSINAGEIVALIGPNGGGKSTLISALAGDSVDLDYDLKFFGTDVRGASASEFAKMRSVIEQRAAALVGYPIFETVSWGAFTRGLSAADLAKNVNENLQHFNLDDIQNNRIDSISGGQWARVLLARVATQAAPVFLGDEPDAALDNDSTLLMYEWLAKTQTTAVISTHDVLSAQKNADRILRVENGSVTEQLKR